MLSLCVCFAPYEEFISTLAINKKEKKYIQKQILLNIEPKCLKLQSK